MFARPVQSSAQLGQGGGSLGLGYGNLLADIVEVTMSVVVEGLRDCSYADQFFQSLKIGLEIRQSGLRLCDLSKRLVVAGF